MNTHRYIARIIIEAITPIAVGSGESSIMTDHLVATDVNGLPFIPGSSLAGVLRHSSAFAMDEQTVNDLFGYQRKEDSRGSKLMLSSAQMIGKEGEALDGLKRVDFSDGFYNHFENLPVRQHVRMSDKGVAQQGGKFDEQVVYKGCRFGFEMEMVGIESEAQNWELLLKQFKLPTFRIGGGTRKGFGEIKVQECKSEVLDLRKDLDRYLDKSSELNAPFWNEISSVDHPEEENTDDWIKYQLELKPDDFFLFGSGFESEDADMTFVTEKIIEWNDGLPYFSEERVLIPASSVKGAIAHRFAFHYNKLEQVYADRLTENDILDKLINKGYWIPGNGDKFNSSNPEERMKMVVDGNPAVRSVFGFTGDSNKAQRGNLLMSDFIFTTAPKKKLLNHVAIDRFTGGAIAGALFSEEVVQEDAETVKFDLLVHKAAFQNENIEIAFDNTLKDICNGMLPLGGGTMRGHGSFTGTLTKNGEEA